jgi:hypothetical protein
LINLQMNTITRLEKEIADEKKKLDGIIAELMKARADAIAGLNAAAQVCREYLTSLQMQLAGELCFKWLWHCLRR